MVLSGKQYGFFKFLSTVLDENLYLLVQHTFPMSSFLNLCHRQFFFFIIRHDRENITQLLKLGNAVKNSLRACRFVCGGFDVCLM